MRTGISVSVPAADRRRLQTIVADPKSSQKHVWRARIVLLTGDGVGTSGIMAATGKSKTCVWRWQERFMEAGIDGLLRDRTRPPGKAPIARDRVAEVVRLTLAPPPHEATHWTVRAMARASGMAVATVQDIWKAHGLAPHRWRSFKLSNDPAFVEKLHAIVGLYVAPPAHAVVLSIDEKSQIQALDRTQPGLPMKKGRGTTMTHMWTAPSSQGVEQHFDRIACDHMSGLCFVRSHMTAGQDGFRNASSEHDCDLRRPVSHPEYLASWIDRSHHLLILLQVPTSTNTVAFWSAPRVWLIC